MYTSRLTLHGTVTRINSFKYDEDAQVRFVDRFHGRRPKRDTFLAHIKVGRLIPIDLAYCGAQFYYRIEDKGAVRTETITPDYRGIGAKNKIVEKLMEQDRIESEREERQGAK